MVAADVSPGALRVARARGVEHVVRADLRSLPAVAGGVFLAGTQFGVGGSVAAFRTTLRALAAATTEGGRVVGDLKDPVAVADSRLAGRDELAAFDRERGVAVRRMRTEYRGLKGPWLELPCPTTDAAREAVAPTPWCVSAVIEDEGPRYFLVLERESAVE